MKEQSTDPEQPATPRLGSILKEFNVIIPPVPGIQLSVHNIEAFQDLLPVDIAQQIIQEASAESRSALSISTPTKLQKQSVVVHKHVVNNREIVLKRDKPSFTTKLMAGPVLEVNPQTKETMAIQEEATWLVTFLPNLALDGILRGLSEVPNDLRTELLISHLGNLGKAASMASARRALIALDTWCRKHYKIQHNFCIKPAVCSWFFKTLNGSASLRAGLVFAHNNYNLQIEVLQCKGIALQSPVTRGPASSTTCRQIYDFSKVSCSEIFPFAVRYIAATKVARIIASLRGIDSRRSKLLSVHDLYFVAEAYDIKGRRQARKRTTMTWACPHVSCCNMRFSEPLIKGWKNAESMCLRPDCGNGLAFLTCSLMTESTCSNSLYVKFYRRIATHLLHYSEEDASHIMSHSDRHLFPNCARIMDVSEEKGGRLGRWKQPNVMYLLYSDEVKFLEIYRLVMNILNFITEALTTKEPKLWPVWGGWEHFFPNPDCGSTSIFESLTIVSNGDESDDESEMSDDIEEQSDSGEEQLDDKSKELPSEWKSVQRVTPKGRKYNIYIAPCGHRERSIVRAVAYHGRNPPDPMASELDTFHEYIALDHIMESPGESSSPIGGSSYIELEHFVDSPACCLDNATASPHNPTTSAKEAISALRLRDSFHYEEMRTICQLCPLPYNHKRLCKLERGPRATRSSSKS